MKDKISDEIEHQARKLLRRQKLNLLLKRKHRERYEKRTGQEPAASDESLPSQWDIHPHFHPVYCIKHRKYLAKVIWQKLQEGTYEPQPAIEYEIPKPNGDKRSVMVFSIPDAAIASLFHRQLTKRNVNIFSSNNYSYRYDRNVFDAIINMRSALSGENAFAIQYDFKKYFDSISHTYLQNLIDGNTFLISSAEKNLIKAFLTHKYASRQGYESSVFKTRDRGVPQGSSISLFLSNIAGHELDKDLEKQGGQFIRFADDVVAVSYKYDDALNVSEAFSHHCKRAGIEINKDKSPGIYIYSDIAAREIRSIESFDYLGHKFKGKEILLSDRSLKRIKERISNIIYIHLIQTPRDRGLFNPNRIGAPFYDWDLVTCINEIRRYVYGGLTQAQLTAFLDNNIRLPRMRGLMSFYPLVTKCNQLKILDGWMVDAIYKALKERQKALLSLGHTQTLLTKNQLITGTWHQSPDATINNESHIPSLVYAWRAARKYYIRYGLSNIQPPGYYSEKIGY